ncbi:MAG: tetratricopeptide repeat protein [Pseudomonadota bacterium]|nr:tetratricopeptide repeat protein [Pseudomonadota bacterium]
MATITVPTAPILTPPVTGPSHIQFDDPPRGAAVGAQPATERIAATLRNAGIDAPNSLYDEALAFAREGHLGQAHARLQMLVCLDPDDSDALLLMAKVHAAQGRPSEALARMDAALAAGGLAPAGAREQLEGAIRAERAREEEHRARIAAREQGEIRSLRNETRTLRSETIRLETEMLQSQERERNWKYAALAVSVVGVLVIVMLAALGGRSAPEAVPVTAAVNLTPPAAVSLAEGAGASAALGSAPTAHVVSPPAVLVPPKAANAPALESKAVVAAVKAPEAKGPRVHVVGSGDTLYKLASRYYGDSNRWKEIEAANKGVLGKSIDLSIGMKLKIP